MVTGIVCDAVMESASKVTIGADQLLKLSNKLNKKETYEHTSHALLEGLPSTSTFKGESRTRALS